MRENSIIGYLKFYFAFLGHRIILFLLLSITVGFLDGIGLALFIPLLDSVNEGTNNSEALGKLKFVTNFITSLGLPLTVSVLLFFMVAVFFVKGAIKFSQIAYQAALRQLFLKKVRYKLLNNLGSLSYRGFLKLDAGTIQNTLTTEVQKLYQSFAHFFQSFQAGAILMVYVTLAFLANPQFAVFVALGAGVSNLLYRKIYKKTKQASVSISKRGSDFNQLLIQCVHHFKYLKATNVFTRYQEKLRVVIDETEKLNRSIGVYSGIMQSVKEPIIVLIVVLVIQAQMTWFNVSLGSIMVSLLLFYRALSFLASVQNSWQSFIQNIGSIYSVQHMQRKLEGYKEEFGTQRFGGFEKAITFRNVVFGFEEKLILDGLNLDIRKNETIALVGESGSGKTTIANLINGLLRVQKGEVLIDGRNINEYDLNDYRQRVGYISQEPVIFNDTLFNNITGWEEPTAENKARFEKAISLAHLEKFVEELPEKELTLLGDNGIRISGGQRQRISIARELYKAETSILILDEATSALDSETERLIQENIESLHGKFTIIVIAHRLSTIRAADNIMVLERGRIVASGTFDSLVQTSGYFQRMVQLQDF